VASRILVGKVSISSASSRAAPRLDNNMSIYYS
jgi:hypothetical protein